MKNMNKSKYGEPYSGDSKFVASCRLLQSVYRTEIGENIRPYKGKDRCYHFGNYIDGGEVSGANFLEYYIFIYAKYRVAYKKPFETINSDRLFNNLLSSQPMAFNLFCPLRKLLNENPEVATLTIRTALPTYPISRVTDVDLEFIPSNYKELTGDKSAMDAIIRFVDDCGNDSFIAIETKYSENLGTNEASDKTREIEIIKKLKCFRPDIEERITKPEIKLTQIYRNFLLSETYGKDISAESYSLIMSPKNHPSTNKEKNSLVNELTDEYKHKVQSITLDEFVNSLIENCPPDYSEVYKRFYDRYLNFDKIDSIDRDMVSE